MTYYDYKVTLKNTTYMTLSDKDFEAYGLTFATASKEDVKKILNRTLKDIADYDDFIAIYEGKEEA